MFQSGEPGIATYVLKGEAVPAATDASTPCEILARLIDFGSGVQRGAIAGDSIVKDGNDPPRKLLLRLAQLTSSALGLSEQNWNTTTSAYNTPVVVRAGTGSGGGSGGTVLADDFNRTAAELVGSTTSGGQTWAGSAGAWSANGSVATANSTTAGLGFNTGSKAMTSTTVCNLVTTAPAASSQLRFAVGATQANFPAGGSYVWAQITVDTAGTAQISIWKRISGTNTQLVGNTSITGVTGNTEGVQPVTVKLDIAIQALTLTLTVGGVDQVITASVTQSEVIAASVTESDKGILGTFAGLAIPANASGTFAIDSVNVAVPQVTGTPGSSLEIWNGAVGGTTLAHQRDRIATMYPSGTKFDWILVTGGHNHGTQEPADFLAVVDSFVTAFKAAHPETKILISSQNPQFAPASTITAHARRQQALRGYALEHGYEYLPVFEAFTAQSGGGASLVLSTDGIHPTTSTATDITTWNGSMLWAAVWMSTINSYRATDIPLTSLP